MQLNTGPVLAAVLLILILAAALLATAGGLGQGKDVLGASIRAIVQLALVSLLIATVLNSSGWTSAFVAMMTVVAAGVAGRRSTGERSLQIWWASAPILAGTAPVLALLLGSAVVPLRPIAVLPMAGVLIGGAMTATSLTGRRALDELRTRRGEYEAALAIGLMPRAAALLICRPAAALALVPALDQTRTVGLVTLPGAFVGMLLGGAEPAQAGATQLLVLIALLTVEAIAALVTLELVASVWLPSS